MALQFYNTASRKKEVFTLPEGVPAVRMYCCGPTVYHFAHIGNLRTYIFEDFLVRTLKYYGYKVNHIVNITDVGHLTSDADSGDDKMEKGAAREGKSVWDIAKFYTDAFMADWHRLNIQEPTRWTPATQHIQEQIELVKTLEEKGYTYRTSDGIYFDSLKFPRYADFARLDVENLRKGSRIDMGEKKNATDFALWKFSPKDKKRAMEWDSPWGVGFPGWHIECSAMAMKYNGPTLDIHCGGTDHIRVHHTNEIAQSECANGVPFARFWMHGEFLRTASEEKLEDGTTEQKFGKMSKSSGEFLTVSLLMDRGFNPLDYRYFALGSHYRNYLNFTWEALTGAKEAFKSLHKKTDPLIGKATAITSEAAKAFQQEFKDAIGDDLKRDVIYDAVIEMTDNGKSLCTTTVPFTSTSPSAQITYDEIVAQEERVSTKGKKSKTSNVLIYPAYYDYKFITMLNVVENGDSKVKRLGFKIGGKNYDVPNTVSAGTLVVLWGINNSSKKDRSIVITPWVTYTKRGEEMTAEQNASTSKLTYDPTRKTYDNVAKGNYKCSGFDATDDIITDVDMSGKTVAARRQTTPTDDDSLDEESVEVIAVWPMK